MVLADGFSNGEEVQIAGASPAQYDGNYVITVTSSTTFTYSMSSSPGSNASDATITASGATTATVSTYPTPLDILNGYEVQITGVSPAVYDGDFSVTVPVTVSLTGDPTYTFTYSLPSTPSVNGSETTSGVPMTVTYGTLYTGPITVSTTTDVRAVTAIDGQEGVVSTETYIFPAAVIDQPAVPGRLSHHLGFVQRR